MAVGVDEPGRERQAASVDDGGISGIFRQGGADRINPSVDDSHVCLPRRLSGTVDDACICNDKRLREGGRRKTEEQGARERRQRFSHGRNDMRGPCRLISGAAVPAASITLSSATIAAGRIKPSP